MRLKIEFETFGSQLNEFKRQGEEIIAKNHFNINKVDFQQIQIEEKIWIENVINYLEESLNEKNNIFSQAFKKASSNKYIVQNILPDNQLVKNFFASINEKNLTLEYISKLISISDLILFGNSEEVLARKNFNTCLLYTSRCV